MRVRKKKYLVLSLLFIFFSFALLLGIIGLPKLEVAAETQEKPILWSISDAVKPNETISLQGNYLYEENNTRVVMAKNAGVEPTEVPDEYIEIIDILSVDEGGEGLLFNFPRELEAGCYDVWVITSKGCSNAVTLNAARPLYLNQEASYAGLPIEIVGRNFLGYEFGVGDLQTSLANVKVKLVSTADASVEYEATVKTGERYTSAESVTGKAVEESNPYRITFTTPDAPTGEYYVFVSNDGKYFCGLQYTKTIEIKAKKTQSWNETVFGTDYATHIGNDPLDLQVYWAQDFNYTNIKTMTPFAAEPPKPSAGDYASDIAEVVSFKWQVVNAIKELKTQGGGVIYFPEGNYYLSNIIDTDYRADNIIFVGAGAEKTKIFYAGYEGTWLRFYASNVGFARMSMEQWDMSDKTKKPDNVLALFDASGQDKIDKQTSKNKFIVDMKFRFHMEDGSESGVNRRCYNSVGGAKNFVYKNIDWEGGQTALGCNVYEYAKIENVAAKFDGANQTFSCVGRYATMENVSIEAMQTDGHGYSCRAGIYVGNCVVKNVGVIGENASNKGEAIMFEPPGGYFSTGTIVSATSRSFTTGLVGGSEIDYNTKLLYNEFAIYIVGGKGAGQMRIFERPTSAIESGSTSNTYTFAEYEKDWDIIPDQTSKYTIISPQEGNTVYRLKAERCLKGIYLYSACFDTVVAECETQDTEGIYLSATSCAENGRLPANANIRIVNNDVRGVSPGSGKGGIVSHIHNWGDNLTFGSAVRNVVIRGNVVRDTEKKVGVTYYPIQTEMPDKRGVGMISTAYSGLSDKVDYKLFIIENNRIENSENGVFCEAFARGVVIRDNAILNTEKLAVIIDESRAPNVWAKNFVCWNITYELDGGTNGSNPDTYAEGDTVTLQNASKDGYTFDGWYTTSDFQANTRVTNISATKKGDITLYAKFVELNVIPQESRIIYILNGGTNGANPDKYTEGTMVTLAPATKEGYTFDGWYTESAFKNKITEIPTTQRGMIALYAKFTKIPEVYEISYVLNGGTNASTNPATFTEGSAAVTLAAATKDGYTFDGWYTTADFQESTKVTEIAAMTSADLTLYAKFTENAVTPPNSSEVDSSTPDSSESDSSTPDSSEPDSSTPDSSNENSSSGGSDDGASTIGGCFGSIQSLSVVAVMIVLTSIIVFMKRKNGER